MPEASNAFLFPVNGNRNGVSFSFSTNDYPRCYKKVWRVFVLKFLYRFLWIFILQFLNNLTVDWNDIARNTFWELQIYTVLFQVTVQLTLCFYEMVRIHLKQVMYNMADYKYLCIYKICNYWIPNINAPTFLQKLEELLNKWTRNSKKNTILSGDRNMNKKWSFDNWGTLFYTYIL